jgi:soluble lytic murein transglycosylase-like protein
MHGLTPAALKGLYDPEPTSSYGMKYLGMAQKLGGGTTCGTILKYNAGHGAKRMNPVSRRILRQGEAPPRYRVHPKVILALGGSAAC